MRTQKIFVLWDQEGGYKMFNVYLDKPSAEIALHEHYTEYWISNNIAKIEEIVAVSYVDETTKPAK